MRRKRFPPTDPREWLNRARANLARAKAPVVGGYYEDNCFEAQQCAEKAIKAIFVQRAEKFPYVHDLVRLLDLLELNGVTVPKLVKAAGNLTKYAAESRYPGLLAPVSKRECDRAIRIAERVLRWADRLISKP